LKSYVTKSGTTYLTRLLLTAKYGFDSIGLNETLTAFDDTGSRGLAGVDLTLKVTGLPDTLVPLYYIPGAGGITRSVSGSVVVDFNQFWVP
jgi:hypothetical protein